MQSFAGDVQNCFNNSFGKGGVGINGGASCGIASSLIADTVSGIR